MKANNTPANVATLLTAAAYVRNETIINGNQAALLDAMIGQIKDLTTKIEAVPAKIAALATQGKEKAAAMWERMAARYQAQFADAVATLRAWLVDFKANRPNVQIDLDEPEDHEPTNPDNNTPTTMNANETTAPEFPELTHAGQCLDIYLHNTGEIYERYTVPAINAVVEAVRSNGWQLPKDEAIKNLTFWTSWQPGTKKALQAAARLVRKYDHLTPTAQDIEQVTRNYAAYIIESATFEIENA